MAEIDMSTRIALKASDMLWRVRARVTAQLPLGPMKATLTPDELRQVLGSMTPEARTEYARRVGVDELLKQVGGR